MESLGGLTDEELRDELELARRRVAELEGRLGLSVAAGAGYSNREMLLSLVANIPDYVYFKDRERRFVLASQPFCDLFQCSLSEVIGKTDEDLFPPEIAAETVADDERVLRGEALIGKEEGDEVIGWVSSSKVPWRDASGEVIGLLGISRDISKLKRVEQALLESLEFSERILAASPLGIAIYRAEGQCVSVNPALPRMVGASAEQLRSQRFPELESWQTSGLLDAAQETLLTGEARQHQARMTTSFGRETWFDCRLARFSSDGEPHLLLLVDDVTEQRKLESKVLQGQKLESLGVLAGGIAHDFNNLLVGVLLNADILRRRLPPASSLATGLAGIQEAARQLAGLTNQMLAYAGKARFAVREVEVGAVVSEMQSLLERSISKKVVLTFALDPVCPRLIADPAQVRQVVMNLVINASEAIGDREGTITVRSAIRRGSELLQEVTVGDGLGAGDYLELSVSDDGCGMDAATAARVFDPFFTTKFTGRGLGLAAVLGILRSHHGAALVKSEPGRGTTFSTFFPLASELAAALPLAPPSPAPLQGGGLVLLVDDEPGVRSAAQAALELLGYRVLLASDGLEALEVFRAHAGEIACVILDLKMPQRDGEETFHDLRQVRADACVILSSGYSEQDAAGRFAGLGLAGFIQKPYELEALSGKLRSVLSNRPPV